MAIPMANIHVRARPKSLPNIASSIAPREQKRPHRAAKPSKTPAIKPVKMRIISLEYRLSN